MYDKDGWPVEEDEAAEKAKWPMRCMPCTSGCKVCSDPEPGSCEECFPLHDRGPDGCTPSILAGLALTAVTIAIVGVAYYVTKRNWDKYQKIRAARATARKQELQARKSAAAKKTK